MPKDGREEAFRIVKVSDRFTTKLDLPSKIENEFVSRVITSVYKTQKSYMISFI